MTNQTPTAADQQPLVQKLTGAQELYTLLSLCSKAPYVMCDAETFDDEIFLFFNEADAKAEMEQRKAHNEPTGPVKLDQKQLLGFLGSLYTLGINCPCAGGRGAQGTGTAGCGGEAEHQEG